MSDAPWAPSRSRCCSPWYAPGVHPVRRELEEVPGREVAIGAVYATLDRLEVKGLAASERGEAGAGGSRRMFAVTPRGARALADSREMRERLWRGVDLVSLLAGGNARGST